MTPTPAPADVLAAINALGSTPNQIADTLFNKGVMGKPCDSDECVVARYLAEQFPGWRVEVIPNGALLSRNGRGDVWTSWGTYHPAYTAICRFDRGERPELEAP